MAGKRECRYADCHDLVHGRRMCMRHYSRLHRLMRSRGELQRTDVAPVAHHITALRAKGFSWEEIGRRGHLDGETLARICNGRNGTILVSRARVDEPRRRIDLDEVAERLSYGQDLADVAAALGFAEASVKEALKQRRRDRDRGAA
jgi:DNA-binding transcriptional MerR regulator